MAKIVMQGIAHSYLPRPKGMDDYALKRIEYTWEDGSAYALLGPSGCGKTTLLNIISGLLKPSEGRIIYDNKDVTALPPEQRNIAQVFQFPVLYDTMTVFQNLAFPLKNRKIDPPKIKKRVHEIAELLDLSDHLNKKAAGLSADAKQKISLGRGLVRKDVAAVLFDEPLTVIDPHLKWQLRRKLKEIHEQLRLTLIYVTHDQVEAMTFAEKVVVMFEGEIVQIGTPEELFENPAHTFVGYFIGSPGMNIIPIQLNSNGVQIENMILPFDPEILRHVRTAKGKLEMGIRPMYLKLHATEQPNSIPVQVTTVEDQGNCKIVSLNVGSSKLYARLKEDEPISASNVFAEFLPEKTKFFENGRLLK